MRAGEREEFEMRVRAGNRSRASSGPDPPRGMYAHTSALGGTGGAQLLVDSLSGRQYVLKYDQCAPVAGAEVSRATMEFIANRVYARMGVRVPEVALYDPTSKQQVQGGSAAAFSTKSLLLLVCHVPNLSSVQSYLEIPTRKGGRSLQLDDPAWKLRLASPGGQLSARLASVRSSAAGGFLVDCLLANWDVCGWLFDNLLIDQEERLWRLDQGGCCIYRAKGTLKNADQFSEVVAELANLRLATRNPNAHFLYAGILRRTDIQQQAQLLKSHQPHILALFPPGSGIRRIVEGRLEYLTSGMWQSAWQDMDASSSSTA